jgi:hypothetical protein
MATSEGPPMMIPTGSKEPKFGTNPIAWAALASSSGGEADFLCDFAVSNVAGNKIGLANRVGLDIEEGWLADAVQKAKLAVFVTVCHFHKGTRDHLPRQALDIHDLGKSDRKRRSLLHAGRYTDAGWASA